MRDEMRDQNLPAKGEAHNVTLAGSRLNYKHIREADLFLIFIAGQLKIAKRFLVCPDYERLCLSLLNKFDK